MTTLTFYKMSDVDELARPEKNTAFTLDSPAIDFFTDFSRVKPLVIDSDTLAVDVKNLMLKAHVKMKFVLNKDNKFIAIVSLGELSDVAIIKKLSDGFARDEIYVTDLMVPKADLQALDLKELKRASISDVIEALKNHGAQHCLVLDKETHKICGIFSAADISRKLHLPIDIRDSTSFYKVFTHTE